MGDTASTTTVALVGDSHAAMWTPAFQQIATQRNWRLEMLSKGACPLLDLPVTNPLSRLAEYLQHCQEWRAQIVARLQAEHPRLIVLSLWRGYGTDESLSGYHAYGSAWIDGLTRLVQQLRDTGAKVLVLGPIPDPHFVVPVCLSGYLDDVAACTPARSSAVNESGIAAEAAATQAGGGQLRRPHRPVLHRRPLPGHRRQHPGLPRRESHDARILPAARPRHRGAVRPRARPQLIESVRSRNHLLRVRPSVRMPRLN